jgi:ferritin-like metal-binding protein YciE
MIQKQLPSDSVQTAREFFVLGLRNIHAAVSQGKTMVEAQIKRLEQYPELKSKLLSHTREKDLQLARIETILSSLGESHSTFKDAALSALGAVSSASTVLAGDEILKNSFSTIGLASFEAASYETLLIFAEEAGQLDAIEPLKTSLSEERSMAKFIEENLRLIARRFLKLKAEDQQASH